MNIGNKLIYILLFLVPHQISNGQGKMDSTNLMRRFNDISYAANSPTQKLDIYIPQGEGPFPVIVAIHGGAWLEGNRTSEVSIYLHGLKRGYAVVSMDYRLSSEAKFPQQIFDVKAAIRWVRANGEKYNLNAGKIAVWGSSAGGYLASLACVSCNVSKLEDLTMGNQDQSGCVQAVVDWFGPSDFLRMDEQLQQSQIVNPSLHSASGSPESLLLGKQITVIPDLVRAANPETYISSDDPPFFIQHGTKDNTVPFQQSENLARKLSSLNKDKVVLDLLDGAGHGTDEFFTDSNFNKVLNFLDKHLK